MIKTVPEILREGAETYEQRNLIYGDNYKRHGEVMNVLFPQGLLLETAEDHNRFGVLTQKVAKLTRYCQNFLSGGHADSLHDDMVYTAMLAELDAEMALAESANPLFHPTFVGDEVVDDLYNSTTELSEENELVGWVGDDAGDLAELPSEEPPVVLPEPIDQAAQDIRKTTK